MGCCSYCPHACIIIQKINKLYKKINREISHPVVFSRLKAKEPIVVIPIHGINSVSENALELGMYLSDEVVAIHISDKKDDPHPLRKVWENLIKEPARKSKIPTPRLEIIYSPYRQIYEPILRYIKKIRKYHPDRLIIVVIPELVEPHWYEHILHNLHAAGLRAYLFLLKDPKLIVIDVPWYMEKSLKS